ncbi:MAG: cysteine hydrolase [Acidimicrobiia bacterium]
MSRDSSHAGDRERVWLPVRAGGEFTAPHYDSASLLTIDIQVDTVGAGAPFEDPDAGEMIVKASALTRAWREAGGLIVHVVRLYEDDGSNVDRCLRDLWCSGWRALIPDTDGAELVPELKPRSNARLSSQMLLSGEVQLWSWNEAVVYKPRWSAFFNTALDGFLSSRRIDTVVVVGHLFENSVRATLQDATAHDLRAVAVLDAISGRVTADSLDEVARWGVEVTTAYDVIEALVLRHSENR